MKEKWNERYSDNNSYYYGTEPNEFLKKCLNEIGNIKNILLPAEGEGRNAVYCGKMGLDVDCYDYSEIAREKALNLAKNNSVKINYIISDHFVFNSNKQYNCIALIYNHLPANDRMNFHKNIIQYLKNDGFIIIEAFSKEQMNYNTGGPNNIELLYDLNEVIKDFENFRFLFSKTEEIFLNEGNGHKGKSSVIRIFAKKI